MAVPAAILELCGEHGFRERADPWIAVQEVRPQPDPEPEVQRSTRRSRKAPSISSPGGMKRPSKTSSGTLAAGWPSGRPHATSSKSVQVDALHRPFGHSPSEP
ncbi:MAG: hypothetical protein ABW245_07240 [Gaiellaceae bacterium]